MPCSSNWTRISDLQSEDTGSYPVRGIVFCSVRLMVKDFAFSVRRYRFKSDTEHDSDMLNF